MPYGQTGSAGDGLCSGLELTSGGGGAISRASPIGWRRSSAVEQGNHNPLVGGSNPPAATIPAIAWHLRMAAW